MSDRKFRIALVGDFAPGRIQSPSERRIVRVDRDTVDAALARLTPEVDLVLSDGERVHFSPRSIDDFHPDRLFDSLPIFRELVAARERLVGEASFARTVARIRQETDAPSRPTRPPESGMDTLGLLERIVEAASYSPEPSTIVREDSELEQLIRRIVAPHLVSEPDSRQQAWLDEMDHAVQGRMREIVGHPDFRGLESRWRAVDMLVRRLETDEQLRVYLVDVPEADLRTDLAEHESEPRRCTLGRLLERTEDGEWAMIVGLVALGDSQDDAIFADRLARLGRTLDAPVIIDALPSLIGASSLDGMLDPDDWHEEEPVAWRGLRRAQQAHWLGLVAPRVLLRVPYGAAGDRCERVRFEEIPDEREEKVHERYLWGSGAACCALLLGEAFTRSGWEMDRQHDIERLPLHVRRMDGETSLLPCSEGVMLDRAALRFIERGIMPLAWMRDSDVVRLARFQSVGSGGASLAGRWERGR
jgi:type VI secretion system protein ImpC